MTPLDRLLLVSIKFGFFDAYKEALSNIVDEQLERLQTEEYLRIQRDKVVISQKAEDLFAQSSNLIELATKLRTIFPKGKKSGKWYWQGSVPEIKAKLQRFFRKYPHISENEVLDATRNYVNSFSEMERDQNMSLLSFFISKDDRSILLEYCENKEDILKRKNRTLN